MITSTTWKHWLKNHINNEKYSDNFDKIVNIMDTEKYSPQGCFNLIDRRFESIVLLTLSTENSIISTFFHERYGDIILGDSLTSIGLCGFGEVAFPVKIDTETVLKNSEEEIEVPSWNDFIKCEFEKDIQNLKVSVKKKVKSFAYLPPFFTNVLLDLKEHSADNYLLGFIKILKIPIKNAMKVKDFEMLEKLKMCHDILIFLWAVIFKDEVVNKSKTRVLTSSNEFSEWARLIHEKNLISEIDQIDQESILDNNVIDIDEVSETVIHDINKLEKERKMKNLTERILPKEKIDLDADPEVNIPEEISPSSASNLEMVFNKLGSLLEKSMDKQDSSDYESSQKRKAWKELDSNMKTCILNASSVDGFDALENPEDSLLTILSKKSPAKVLTHLYFMMNGNDVIIVQGLATAISRMILLSTPTWKQISNLSPFFVPPRNSKTVNNTNFLKLHIMEKEGRGYEEKDIDLITSQVPQWSYEITGLRKQIKNFALLCSLLFGEKSILSRSLNSWDKHILDNEQCYDDYRSEHKHFIVCVLNKIHQNIQRHLINCQRGWNFINWQDVNFEDIQRAIVTESFVVEKPSWVKETPSLDNSTRSRNNNNGNSKWNLDPPSKKQKIDNGPVFNPDKEPRFKIPNDSLKFGEVFTAKVRKQFDKLIKNEDGEIICHKYHIKGICNSNCKLRNSHKKLSSLKTKELAEFVKFAFNAHPKLNNNGGSNIETNESG